MKLKRVFLLVAMGLAWPGRPALAAPAEDLPVVHMPYAQSGLTPRQAAAHLLSRFTFGERPGDVDAVVKQGLDVWFAEQLAGNLTDDALDQRLAPLGTMNLPDAQLSEIFLNGGEIRARAIRHGLLGDPRRPPRAGTPEQKREEAKRLAEFAHQYGYRSDNDLMQELYAQKLLRAVYSKNQVREVLTDFWFNHFNVSRTNNQARPHLLSYERDAIRPHVLGSFRELLGATAKHPAMLFYLNNAESVAPRGSPRLGRSPADVTRRYNARNSKLGLNENFARELMELHTLGVDGGYRQHDVVEVARAITGWSSYGRGPQVESYMRRMDRDHHVIHQGSFYFLPYLHDAGSKTILGQSFPAGHGLDEGERVLDLLASHRSTARFLARKLAVRFVGDHPGEALIRKLAGVYLKSHGDLVSEYVAIVESPEFWSPAARRAKVKTAFEYVVSGIRALNGDLTGDALKTFARTLPPWLDRMGQPLYGYQAPTGFPDRAEIWVSSGSLVNRINFAFALVTHRLKGVQIDTAPLLDLQGTPLDRRVGALASDLLPGRDTAETIKLVKANMDNPEFLGRIRTGLPPAKPDRSVRPPTGRQDFSDTEKIVGILVSSPEFQRR